MKRNLLTIIASALSTMFGCNKNTTNCRTLPEITSQSEPGFCDLVFAITDNQHESDGGTLITAEGRYESNAVGVKLLLGPSWKKQTLGGSIPCFVGTVLIQSAGQKSDRLVQAMDQVYQTSLEPGKMARAPIEFSVITLEGDPRNLQSGPVKIKLFIESEDEDRYAELYINIDVRNGQVMIKENDPDYREGIIRALSSQ